MVLLFLIFFVEILKFYFFENFIFNPINFNKFIIVKHLEQMEYFLKYIFYHKQSAARIGRVAFLDPEILIVT